MNLEIKTKWVAALRSGEFTQGKEALKHTTDDSSEKPTYCHCCLGVLTEIYTKEKQQPFSGNEHQLKASNGDEFLCVDVMAWAGLNDNDPVVTLKYAFGDNQTTLANLNDGGKTFVEIADIIEANL